MPGARQNENRAARIFVARRVRARQRLTPDCGRVDEGLRRDGGKRGFGNANVGEPDRAAQRPPRQQEMAGLQAKEGHARGRLDRDAANLAGFAIDPGRNVDGEHASAGASEAVDALDDRFRFAVDVAGEPGPEQRVDHAVGAREVNRRGVEGRSGIASGGERRIAFQRLAPAEQSDLDRVSAQSEQPRGDEAVAAVPAGPAEDGDPAARLREPRRLVSDRKPRPLHERNPRRSGRNRKAIGLAHFNGRQQFRERQGIAHEGEGARRSCAAQAAKTRFPSRGILLYPADADPR